jgi:hypothetical protein
MTSVHPSILSVGGNYYQSIFLRSIFEQSKYPFQDIRHENTI